MPDVFMPRLSDTMTEGVISAWLKQEGDTVQRGDVLAEIETDKAVMELESYESGVLSKIIAPAGATIEIGKPIAVIGEPGAEPVARPVTSVPATTEPQPATPPTAEAGPAAPQSPVTAPAAPDTDRIRATPLVRRLANEHGIDLGTVTGTGPNGRIVRADIQHLLDAPPSGLTEVEPASGREDETLPLNAIRRVTAARLAESATVPHFHLTAVVDATSLLELRRSLNEQVFADGARCSVTDLLVRAVGLNLAQHREVNASWAGDSVIRHAHVNVGIAVALDDGLIVPVLRDADQKPLTSIAAQARELTSRARAGRLKPEEFTGGTFTISNLGTFGIEHFTAVINPPEAAILAVGSAREEPVVRDGVVTVRPLMRLTMTSDHRVLDGAVSAAFLRDLVGLLEQPLRLLG